MANYNFIGIQGPEKIVGSDGHSLFPTGWVKDEKSVDEVMNKLPHPLFGAAAAPIKDSGAGKTVLLYMAVRAVMQKTFGAIKDLIHKQTIGDCVSHGWSLLVDFINAVQINSGMRQKWAGETATEVMYGGARVTVGNRACGRGDGAVGAWAAKYAADYGTIIRGSYPGIDLSTYSGSRAKQLGWDGPPESLSSQIREHPLKTVSRVDSYEEARDAIANGYPVAVCSNWGFQMQRGSDGFARPQGTWPHCMCFIACDDAFSRPGLLCMNSWGPDWISGPKRHDQPEGSFWVDADVCNRMFREGDSFTASGFEGYPAQDLDYDFLKSAK